MSDKEVLSQDEIDALLTSVDSGEIDSDTGIESESAPEVRPYDLTSSDRIVRGRLPTLELLGEKFARQLRLDLQSLLKYSIEVGAGGVQILDYGDYITTLYVPTSISIVNISPLAGHGMVVIDAKLVSRMVDQFFGGDGKNISVEGRDFTPTEKRVIGRILDLIYRDLADAWSEVLPVTLSTDSAEINPALINLFSEDDVMMVNTYHIELESGGGEIHITIPYAALEPYKEVLDASFRVEELSRNENWTPALQQQLLDCDVPLRCSVGGKELRLRELMGLQVGDFITIDMPEEHLVYASDVPAFYARLGESKGNLALEVANH